MLKIDFDDIADEVSYWNSAIICYVLGSNPPFDIFSGFVKRVWGRNGLDKVVPIRKDLFQVRFHSVEQRDRVLLAGPFDFDKKPLIMMKWHPDLNVSQIETTRAPIWIKLHGLEAGREIP